MSLINNLRKLAKDLRNAEATPEQIIDILDRIKARSQEMGIEMKQAEEGGEHLKRLSLDRKFVRLIKAIQDFEAALGKPPDIEKLAILLEEDLAEVLS